MKKPIEHEELLMDMLAENESFRAATLQHGLAALRRARMLRRAVRGTLAIAPFLALAVMLTTLGRRAERTNVARWPGVPPPAPAPVVKTVEGTTIRVLSDEELLDFFQGRPVALAGRPGHQHLYLLDQEKN